MTLTQYVEENDKLLAALGIFSGLALFSVDLEKRIKYIPSSLSFIFLGLTVITGLELFARFPKGERVLAVTVRLYIFRLLMGLALIGVVLCWLALFHDAWRVLSYPIVFILLVFAIAIGIGLPAFWLLSFSNWYNQQPTLAPWLQRGLMVVAGIGAWILTPRLYPYVLQFLDLLAQAVRVTPQ